MHKLILVIIIMACGSFAAFAQNEKIKTTEEVSVVNKVEGDIFFSVQQMPEFPGNSNALMKYIKKNVVYPEKARKDNIRGRVIVQFVVTSTGKIVNAVVKRDLGGGCGEEALRVVGNMPDWKPGKQNGKPVNVYYTLPVPFD